MGSVGEPLEGHAVVALRGHAEWVQPNVVGREARLRLFDFLNFNLLDWLSLPLFDYSGCLRLLRFGLLCSFWLLFDRLGSSRLHRGIETLLCAAETVAHGVIHGASSEVALPLVLPVRLKLVQNRLVVGVALVPTCRLTLQFLIELVDSLGKGRNVRPHLRINLGEEPDRIPLLVNRMLPVIVLRSKVLCTPFAAELKSTSSRLYISSVSVRVNEYFGIGNVAKDCVPGIPCELVILILIVPVVSRVKYVADFEDETKGLRTVFQRCHRDLELINISAQFLFLALLSNSLLI